MRLFVFTRADTFFDASRRSVAASPDGTSGVQSMHDGEARLCTSRERRFDAVLARRSVRASASRVSTREVHDDALRASIASKLHRRTSPWMPSLMALSRRGDCATMRRSLWWSSVCLTTLRPQFRSLQRVSLPCYPCSATSLGNMQCQQCKRSPCIVSSRGAALLAAARTAAIAQFLPPAAPADNNFRFHMYDKYRLALGYHGARQQLPACVMGEVQAHFGASRVGFHA